MLVEFKGSRDIDRWASSQSPEILSAVAARGAARAVPLLWVLTSEANLEITLASLRAILTAGVRSRDAADAIKLAARQAHKNAADYSASDFVSNGTTGTIGFVDRVVEAAARSARAASSDRDPITAVGYAAIATSAAASDGMAEQVDLVAVAVDAEILETNNPGQLWLHPLWPNREAPRWLEKDMVNLLSLWRNSLANWEFWLDWYEGLLEGRPPDWELWHDIVLIPDEDWSKGPQHVAGKIDDVRASLLARRVPLAETIRFDPDEGGFVVEAAVVQRQPLVNLALARVEDAVDDALAEMFDGLRETDSEVRVLRRTIARYSNDLQRVEMDVTSVQRSLMRRIATSDLPASGSILALIDAAGECGHTIRAGSAEIAANRQVLDALRFVHEPYDVVARVGEVRPIALALTKVRLHDELDEDFEETLQIPHGRSATLAPVDGTNASSLWVRIANRHAKLLISLKQLINEAHDSETMKLMRMIGATSTSVVVLASFVAWLLGLLLL